MADLSRLDQQITFLNEADRLKSTLRATTLCDGSRFENTAEHSWHLALYALVLADQAGPDVDLGRVIKMLIVHDLVEIDAGDTPLFGSYNAEEIAAAEAAAADRIFGLLPEDLGENLRALWDEFEAAQTPCAQFAKSLDRFQPPMQNLASGGGSWETYNVTPDAIEKRVGPTLSQGAPGLWRYAKERIDAFFAAKAE
ncbi:MAG: HD domain-containing protein [Pseudomonadota bacterium]